MKRPPTSVTSVEVPRTSSASLEISGGGDSCCPEATNFPLARSLWGEQGDGCLDRGAPLGFWRAWGRAGLLAPPCPSRILPHKQNPLSPQCGDAQAVLKAGGIRGGRPRAITTLPPIHSPSQSAAPHWHLWGPAGANLGTGRRDWQPSEGEDMKTYDRVASDGNKCGAQETGKGQFQRWQLSA